MNRLARADPTSSPTADDAAQQQESQHRCQLGDRACCRESPVFDKAECWGQARRRVRTDLDHCRVKGSKVAGAESVSLFLVIGDVFKVFNPRRLAEEVAHFSKAWA